MVPRTQRGAIEKLWRVRHYLTGIRFLTLEEYFAIDAAVAITYKAQRAVADY
jgi:hypothetical protein